ncbi:MAG: nucleotidyltransferase domain-containing protein [bacterium]
MPEIVQRKSYGSVKVFWLNRESSNRELVAIAQKLGDEDRNIKEIILFGSQAEDRATPFSDIDILILVEREDAPFGDRPLRYIDFFSGLGLDIDIFVYEEELN